jgi:hypothetical protein
MTTSSATAVRPARPHPLQVAVVALVVAAEPVVVVALAAAAAAVVVAVASKRGHPMLSTILVVKSDGLSRLAVASYLRNAGYLVLEGSSGAEACSVMLERGADIVLCDLDLDPPVGAPELGAWAREHHPRARVIFKAGIWSIAAAATKLCGSPAYTCADHVRRVVARGSRLAH